MFNESIMSKSSSYYFSRSQHETAFLNQSPGLIFRQKISLTMTSSSKAALISSWHVDVDMRQELMKLRVSFDKSGFPDPLISQTPRRVIYAFFVSSRTQFVRPVTVACYILI